MEKIDIGINDFEFIKIISKGTFSTIWLVKKKVTGDYYAMKIIEIKSTNVFIYIYIYIYIYID